MIEVNGKEVDMGSIDIDGIEGTDYPDFIEAYACSAQFCDGDLLIEEELQELTDKYLDVLNQLIIENQLYL